MSAINVVTDKHGRKWPLFFGAKSICTCGHKGDGEGSAHEPFDGPRAGHGSCTVKGCKCLRFRWDRRTAQFKRLRKQAQKAGAS